MSIGLAEGPVGVLNGACPLYDDRSLLLPVRRTPMAGGGGGWWCPTRGGFYTIPASVGDTDKGETLPGREKKIQKTSILRRLVFSSMFKWNYEVHPNEITVNRAYQPAFVGRQAEDEFGAKPKNTESSCHGLTGASVS